jgi:DNA-binding LacI/PurR family transcriptional regulator
LGYVSPRGGKSGAAASELAPAPRVFGYLYSSHLEAFRTAHDERMTANDALRGVDFYSQLVIGLQQAMLRSGLQMELAEALDRAEAQIQFLAQAYPQRICGLLCSGMLFDQTVAYIRERRIPTVYIGGSDETRGQLPSISIDDAQCAYLATRHLVTLGHERVAFVGDFRCDFTNYQRHRLGGFCQALLAMGLPVVQEHLYSTDLPAQSDGDELVERMLSLPQPPTGVVTATGLQAIVILNALARRGVNVPQDISVIAVGNPLVADYTQPPLSGVHVPIVTMGAQAVRLLDQYTQQADLPAVTHLMPGTLVLRASTGARSRPTGATVNKRTGGQGRRPQTP